jgi:hypothetical protein
MKHNLPIIIIFALVCVSFVPTPASALSCLPTDMYLESVIGDENVVIFAAKTVDTITESTYTAEALTVNTAYQGYVEKSLMAYHTKDATWGYLCNSGPKGNNTEGVYIATRNDTGTYQVTQRLESDSELFVAIKAKLANKDITGEVIEQSTEDRINQITTTIKDLLTTILILIKEQLYWQRSL